VTDLLRGGKMHAMIKFGSHVMTPQEIPLLTYPTIGALSGLRSTGNAFM